MVLKSVYLSLLVSLSLISMPGLSSAVYSAPAIIPVSGSSNQTQLNEESSSITLEDFNRAVSDGDARSIRGVFVQDILALRVIQQPAGAPEFVSSIQGTVTHFRMASEKGVTGLLAHNYAAGEQFFDLEHGHTVNISYGDGTVKSYLVNRILRFKALQPDSADSDFINLDTNEHLTASELFSQVYSGEHRLTLQTCIQQGEEDAWGRLFIIADPIQGL